MKALLLPLLFVSLIGCPGCAEKEGRMGGGCTFAEEKHPIQVTEIVPLGRPGKYDVRFVLLPVGEHHDTMSYMDSHRAGATSEELAKDSVAVGGVCSFVINRTVTGDCAGNEYISLKRYEQ